MFISSIISLIISSILVNVGLAAGNLLSFVNYPSRLNSEGKVLGAGEGREMSLSDQPSSVRNRQNFSQTMAKLGEDIKVLALPQLSPASAQNADIMKLPESKKILPVDRLSEEKYKSLVKLGVVLDLDSGNFIYQKEADKKWPIASITKLAAALTFLDYNPDWEKIYTIQADDKRDGGKIDLFTGEKIKVKDLFYFSLVGSDNVAAAALVKASGLTEEDFVRKMNAKMSQLGLANTHFSDVVGLDNRNVATAKEVARLAQAALANQEIAKALLTKQYTFITAAGKTKSVVNTNELLRVFPQNNIELLGGKTGRNDSSGYCLMTKFADHVGREIIVVVLGAETDQARFNQAKEIVNLVYNNNN